MADRGFCPSCGEDVPVYRAVVEKAQQQMVELRCAYCGFSLEWVQMQKVTSGGTLIVADDSETMVALIRDYFAQRNMFEEIWTARNGGEFLQAAVRALRSGHLLRLVIMDIRMPVLSGAQAAIALRWIEKGFECTRSTPIIFLSAFRVDESLKRVLSYCAPAHYINKEAPGTPEALMQRLYQVASRFLT